MSEALTLRKTELALMQAELPWDANAGTHEQGAVARKINEGIAKKAWLKHLLLGELSGANGLLQARGAAREPCGEGFQGGVDLHARHHPTESSG